MLILYKTLMTRKPNLPCPIAIKPSYELGVVREGRFIKFYPCEIISFNKNDVKEHYCARCHRFIEEEYAYAS